MPLISMKSMFSMSQQAVVVPADVVGGGAMAVASSTAACPLPSHLLCSGVTFTLQDDLVASLRNKGVVRSKAHACRQSTSYVCSIQRVWDAADSWQCCGSTARHAEIN